MSPTKQLHKDLTKALKDLGKGPAYLADLIGEKRITVHHWLRRPNKDGKVRNMHYDMGFKLRAWHDNYKINKK